MKEYQKPELDVTAFVQDVVTTSPNTPPDHLPDGNI